MSLCLIVGALVVPLGTASLTLGWVHSVERQLWEEDWRLTAAGLVLDEARVAGSGAGMEPPEGARLQGGAWRWRPDVPPQADLVLRRSGATADWRICRAGSCQPLAALVPPDADPVTLAACPR